MARPIVAEVDLAALAANLAPCAGTRRRRRCWPSSRRMRMAMDWSACCRRSAMQTGSHWSSSTRRSRCASAGYSRTDPAARRLLRRRRARRRSRGIACTSSCTNAEQIGCWKGSRSRARIDVFVKVEHRHEPARRSRPRMSPRVCHRLDAHCRRWRSIRLMTHFARADEVDGHRRAARANSSTHARDCPTRARWPTPRACVRLRRNRRRRRASGHHALWRVAVRRHAAPTRWACCRR